MSQYKLKEGKNVRQPVVQRTEINVYVPVLLICFAMAFLSWLYVVGLSRITSEVLNPETVTTVVEEPTQGEPTESDTTETPPTEVCTPWEEFRL
jgi:hypothetical protein